MDTEPTLEPTVAATTGAVLAPPAPEPATTQGERGPVEALVADPGMRAKAFVLDLLLFGVTLGVGWLVWSMLLWGQGKTPGKSLIGLQVVDRESRVPATWSQMAVRELLGKWLLGTVTLGIAEVVGGAMVLGERRQALWDTFGKTTVIDHRKPKGWGFGFWLSVGWLVFIIGIEVLVPVLPLKDPDRSSADLFAGMFSEGHIFGADELGRDLFSRLLWGGRLSLSIGFVSLVFGFFIGGFLGITAGFFRGRYEKFVMAGVDVMLSFPALILALALLRLLSDPGTLEGSFGKVVIVLTVLSVPALARITRANTLVYSQREFVVAAKSLGAKPWRILRKEILPNVLPAMLSFSFIALAILVVAEGALAFLGLSVEAPTVTVGKLIDAGRQDIDKAAYLALVPCAYLFLTLLALNWVGDKLQARFAVREANV